MMKKLLLFPLFLLSLNAQGVDISNLPHDGNQIKVLKLREVKIEHKTCILVVQFNKGTQCFVPDGWTAYRLSKGPFIQYSGIHITVEEEITEEQAEGVLLLVRIMYPEWWQNVVMRDRNAPSPRQSRWN